MDYGYQIPTTQEGQSVDEEKGLVGAGAEMGKSESKQSGTEEAGSWPLAVAKRAEPAVVRPHRPWSEMPKK